MTVGTSLDASIGFGYAQNISIDGLAIDAQALTSEEKIPSVGGHLRMKFKLPKSDLVITVSGEILRVDRAGDFPRIALKFVDATPDIRSEISRFVSLHHGSHLTSIK
jgi:hypothetical protein